ncbi:MAG: TolC family protein [Chitinophagia bacterium]|jgi:outer membrane protein|nr:TolC family protein [Chitinophagia bacterium]
MSMFARLFFVLLSVSLITGLQAQDDRWDLRRCVEYGFNNNINVRQAEVQAQSSEINYTQSTLQRVPSLSYGLTHGFSFGRTLDRTTNIYTDRSAMFQQMSVSSNVLLFNFNRLKNTEASSELTYEADKLNIERIKNDIGLNIAQLYLRALLSYEQTEIARIVLEQTKAQYRNTRKLVDAGSLPELNAAELEATVARDSATYVQAKSQAELDKLSLKALLTLPADRPFELVIPSIDQIPVENILLIRPDEIYEIALKTQPQIRVNDLRKQASEKSLDAALAQMKPSLSMFGQLASNFNQFLKTSAGFQVTGEQATGAYAKTSTGVLPVYAPTYSFNFSKRNFGEYWSGYGKQLRDQFGQGVGLSLNIPFFNGGSARANANRAKLDIKRSELNIDRDKIQLKQDVFTAYYSATGAYQTFIAREKALATAVRSYELATKRYDLGVMQTIEWLTNQNNLTRAKVDKVVAQYEYLFRMKVLEFYKGQGIKL